MDIARFACRSLPLKLLSEPLLQREAYLDTGAGNTESSIVTRTLWISQTPSKDSDASSGEGWGKSSSSG